MLAKFHTYWKEMLHNNNIFMPQSINIWESIHITLGKMLIQLDSIKGLK